MDSNEARKLELEFHSLKATLGCAHGIYNLHSSKTFSQALKNQRNVKDEKAKSKTFMLRASGEATCFMVPRLNSDCDGLNQMCMGPGDAVVGIHW